MALSLIHILFNSLRELQTKPLPPIRHICDFSRGALNVRSMRSHPTLAPRPQICLIGGNGFCAMAGEDELNRGKMCIRDSDNIVLVEFIVPIELDTRSSDKAVFSNNSYNKLQEELKIMNKRCV